METDPLPRPKWKRGDIIRQKLTGHPYKVLHLLKNCSTLVEDMEDRSTLRACFNIDTAHYNEFSTDQDMELSKGSLWRYNEISL